MSLPSIAHDSSSSLFNHCEGRSHSVPGEILGAPAGVDVDANMISYGPMSAGMGLVVSSSGASNAAAAVHDVLLRILR